MLLICAILIPQGEISVGEQPMAVVLLLLSGAIAIGLGDTFYLTSLKIIGARNGTLLRNLAPPIAALISLMFLQEILDVTAWIGILLIVCGIAWVVSARPNHNFDQKELSRSYIKMGVLLGLLAAVTEATGTVLSRAALTSTEINPLASTFIRLAGGELVLIIYILIKRHPLFTWSKLPEASWLSLNALTAIVIGTFFGIWLQQMSLQIIPAGIALTLISTTPLFVLFITALKGEKIPLRTFLGIAVAFIGVTLLFST